MRENKIFRTGLDLFTTYQIKGLNLDRLLNLAKKRGIALYNVKKYGNNRLIVTVSFKESRKFFAIAKELCYNIKKLRDGGKALPLLKLYRSIGILVGAIVISVTAAFCDDLILGFSFKGSGSVYSREVQNYLTSQGTVKFSRFSSIDLNVLEDGILSSNPHLSFVSCTKVGSRLLIDLELSKDKVPTLKGDVYSLISDCDGTIESVKVYRGTAAVIVGQTVKKGDLLVDGYALIKEQIVKINVIAEVKILCDAQSTYLSKNANDKDKAVLFAEQEHFNIKPLSSTVTVTEQNGNYIYTVNLSYRRVLCVG